MPVKVSICERCKEVNEVYAKNLCKKCYKKQHVYSRPIKYCIACNEIKEIHAKDLCLSCYNERRYYSSDVCVCCREIKEIYSKKLCKVCYNKKYKKEHVNEIKIYNNQNKDKRRQYTKTYSDTHKEELKQKYKKYYSNNKEKIKEYNKTHKDSKRKSIKTYYEKNKDKKKIYAKEYSIKNKESIQIRNKKYRENNKERIKKYKKEYCKNRNDSSISTTIDEINTRIKNIKSIGIYVKNGNVYSTCSCLFGDHVWNARIDHLINGSGCPFCKNRFKYEKNIIFYIEKLIKEKLAKKRLSWNKNIIGNNLEFDGINNTETIAVECQENHHNFKKEDIIFIVNTLENDLKNIYLNSYKSKIHVLINDYYTRKNAIKNKTHLFIVKHTCTEEQIKEKIEDFLKLEIKPYIIPIGYSEEESQLLKRVNVN